MADLEVFSQRDRAWATRRLGLSKAAKTSTIGAYGCAVTCIAQKLTMSTGLRWTPDRVQDALLLGDGFRHEHTFNLVAWWNLPRLFNQFVWNGAEDYTTRPVPEKVLARLYGRLANNDPVILYVDASAYMDGLQQHFVLAIGRLESGSITIANPWNGKQETLRAYGKTDPIAICGIKWLDLKQPGFRV